MLSEESLPTQAHSELVVVSNLSSNPSGFHSLWMYDSNHLDKPRKPLRWCKFEHWWPIRIFPTVGEGSFRQHDWAVFSPPELIWKCLFNYALCVLMPGGCLNQTTCAFRFLDQMLLMLSQFPCHKGFGENIHISGDIKNGRAKKQRLDGLKLIYRGKISRFTVCAGLCFFAVNL